MSTRSDQLYERILTTARNRLPGATDDSMRYELFQVLDEFLRYTHAWQEEIDVPFVAGDTESEFESEEANAQVTTLMSAVNENGTPIHAVMPAPGVLQLVREAQETMDVTIVVGLTITDPVDSDGYPGLPDWILERWHAALTDGLIHRMMMQPHKPFSNADLAMYHGRRFAVAKTRAKIATRRQNLYGGQRWTFPQNFATGRR